MRDRSLRDLLADPIADVSAELQAQQEEWHRVRTIVADVAALSADERAQRLLALRASSDPIERRAASLIELDTEIGNFLDAPAGPAVAPPATAPVYQSDDAIGPYRIVSLLGQGGMGQVYLADDTRLFRKVAVKVVTADPADAALLREARIAASLHHESIVAVYDVIEAHGRLHIVMERLTGQTLAARAQSRHLEPREAARIVARVLDALEHAHGNGVIHCDVKPANVFVLPSGAIKVLDFGLARSEARTGHSSSFGVAGTLRFLPPERLLGAPANPRTDVYSVGVMLADLLAGDAALSRPNIADGPLAAVAAKAMSMNSDERYASATEMRAALEQALTPKPRSRRDERYALAPFAVAAVVLGAVVGAGVWYVASRGPAERPVVAVDMSPIGGDPLAGHVAAAYEELVERSLAGARNLVVVRQDSASPTAASEVGASHILTGVVQRVGDVVDTSLTLKSADDVVLASHTVRGQVADPQDLAAAVMNGTDQVLRRGGITVTRTTIDAEAVRRVLSVNGQAFEDYAQAREYLRTPEVPDSADLAIELLMRALERDPNFVLAHASLAEAYWQKYQSTRDNVWTDRARAAALEALRLQPGDPAVRSTLALIYRGMGRRDEALSEVSKAIALEPTNDDMYRLRARLHAELGRLDSALADLSTARSLRPGYWDNHRATGLVLYEAGRFDDAVPHFRRVTELRPNNASAYQTLGTALHAAGHVDDALRAYERSLSIAPNANTYANIAKLHYDAGRYDEASKAYRESIRIQPKVALTHRNLGDTLTKLGQTAAARVAYETAIALSDAALQVNPSDDAALSTQALCHAKLGRVAQAVQLAKKVLTAERPSAASRYRSGVALVLAGERETGVTEIVRAIENGYSRNEVALDPDVEAVLTDPRLRAALEQ